MKHTNLNNYKLADVDKNKIKAAARKALMTADNLYYSWDKSTQEKFRVSMNEEVVSRVEHILLSSILDIKCSLSKVDDTWRELPFSELSQMNWGKLLTTGVGDDFIFLNESLAENTSLLDFSTLYDYNYNDHLFQEKWRKKDSSNYKSADYYALKHPFWFRLIINDDFYYATGTSLATYICDELSEASSDLIDELIPNEFVEGKDNGKEEKGGFLWDMKVDANGLEAQLDELNSRSQNYQMERWLILSQRYARLKPAAYVKEDNFDFDDDPHITFIFNNEQALKLTHWQSFLIDIEPLIVDFFSVNQEVENESDLLKKYITDNYNDIINNFDPKIVKFKKKRKVIMAKSFLDSFE